MPEQATTQNPAPNQQAAAAQEPQNKTPAPADQNTKPEEKVEENLFKHFESNRLHISGLIVSDYSMDYSHWNAKKSLGEWLHDNSPANTTAASGYDCYLIGKWFIRIYAPWRFSRESCACVLIDGIHAVTPGLDGSLVLGHAEDGNHKCKDNEECGRRFFSHSIQTGRPEIVKPRLKLAHRIGKFHIYDRPPVSKLLHRCGVV